MKLLRIEFLLFWAFSATSCGAPKESQAIEISFAAGAKGWTFGFADYPVGSERFYELTGGERSLPIPLDTSKMGLFVSGNNHSDDLFMFIKGQVDGLDAVKLYRIGVEVELATDAPSGCGGVGGAPGEGVMLKAGAKAAEPVPLESETHYFLMNWDKGNQAVGGVDALALGTIENSNTDCYHPVYELKMLASPYEQEVHATAAGKLWIMAGTDSGFEGTTAIYFTKIRIKLNGQ